MEEEGRGKDEGGRKGKEDEEVEEGVGGRRLQTPWASPGASRRTCHGALGRPAALLLDVLEDCGLLVHIALGVLHGFRELQHLETQKGRGDEGEGTKRKDKGDRIGSLRV